MNIRDVPARYLVILVATGLALLAIALIAPLFIDVSSYVPEIESKLSEAMGADVTVEGRAGISLIPLPGFTLNEAKINVSDIASADAQKISGRVALLPLLRGKVLISKMAFYQPNVFIKDYTLLLKTLRSRKSGEGGRGLRLGSIGIEDGELVVRDEKGSSLIEASGVDIDVDDLRYDARGAPVSFDGGMSADSVRTGGVEVSVERSRFGFDDKKFKAPRFLTELFGGMAENSIEVDLSGEVPGISFSQKASGLDVGEVSRTLYGKEIAKGRLDVRMDIKAAGDNLHGLLSSTDGRIHASGRDIELTEVNVDRIVERIKANEEVDLVDIGSFLLVGPIGSVVTKGYDITASYLTVKEGGRTGIDILNADWRITNGIATAEDVAFRTSKNRIALKGNFNLADKRFKELETAVLDGRGCAIFIQRKTDGPFESLRSKGEPIIRTVLAPVKKVLDMASEVLLDRKCDRFYAGVVKHP